MFSVSAADWPRFVSEWIDGQHPTEGASCEIWGRLDEGGASPWFQIGATRDGVGSLVRVNPTAPPSLTLDRKRARDWNSLWGQALVRAGYRSPGLDPATYRTLSTDIHPQERVEFIFDTSSLVSGAGHWLVYRFGTHCDLVRTVITDKEIQGFQSQWANRTIDKDIAALRARTQYLAAVRFLDQLPNSTPLWRSLDVDDSALLLASGSKEGQKSPAADTLLLRAARRAIQEGVRGLRRFFVTDDVALARAASHMLPPGATICTWTEPVAERGEVVGPTRWWPSKSYALGTASISDLGTLLRQFLCICSSIQLRRGGRTLEVREYVPGRNQYPSMWRAPVLWVDENNARTESTTARELGRDDHPPHEKAHPALKITAKPVEQRDPPAVPLERPTTPKTEWPLRTLNLDESNATGSRLAAPRVVGALQVVLDAARGGLQLSEHVFDSTKKTDDQFWNLLSALELVDDNRSLLPRVTELLDVVDRNDLDGLAQLLARAQPFSQLLTALRRSSKFDPESGSFAGLNGWKLIAYSGLARALGQATQAPVSARKEKLLVHYGGAAPERSQFESWMLDRVARLAASEPLSEVPVSTIAAHALRDLHVSPVRFERALVESLNGPLGEALTGSKGGAVADTMTEKVVSMADGRLSLIPKSADGIAGWRTLSVNDR